MEFSPTGKGTADLLAFIGSSLPIPLIAPLLGGYQGFSSLPELFFLAVDGRYPFSV
jgi:hypothetical protein